MEKVYLLEVYDEEDDGCERYSWKYVVGVFDTEEGAVKGCENYISQVWVDHCESVGYKKPNEPLKFIDLRENGYVFKDDGYNSSTIFIRPFKLNELR